MIPALTNTSGWGGTCACDAGGSASRTLKGARGDDWIFGVSAISLTGVEVPVSSAVPGGQFAPIK